MSEELVHKQEELTTFIEDVPIGMYSINREGYIVWTNDKQREMLGYQKEDCIGQHVSELYVDLASNRKVIEHLDKQENLRNYDAQMKCKDNSNKDVLISSSTCSQSSEFAQNRYFTYDITARKCMERALRKSENIFRLLTENLREVFWMTSINLTDPSQQQILYISPAYEDIWERDRQSLYHDPMRWIEAIHPEDRERVTEHFMDQVIQGGFDHQYRIIRPDGSIRWIRDRGFPLSDYSGETITITGFAEDITQRKATEDRLRLLESVVVNANDAVIVTEAEPFGEPGPRIVYVNEAFTQLTGYQSEEVIGQTPRILQGPKTDRKILDKIRAALETWQPIRVELVNYCKDGSEFWVELMITPITNESGWFTHWISVQRDITERKQTEMILQQNEQRFRALIEHASDIIILLDTDGMISYISPSIESTLGYFSQDFIGKPMVTWLHPNDQNKITKALSKSSQRQKAENIPEIRWRSIKEEWRFFEVIIKKLSEGTAFSGFVVTAHDMTERKKIVKMQQDLEREKELSELKLRFFSMASHEFRTPLSVILIAAQTIENYGSIEQAEKLIRNTQRIQSSVYHLRSMLTNVLSIARTEAEKVEFSPQHLNLYKFCSQIMKVLYEEQKEKMSESQIKFALDGTNREVFCDPKLLHSMLTNLLSNAVKYSPKGGVIDFSVTIQSEWIEFVVKDQGIGIPLENQSHLFEPFYRGENVGKVQGSGLGLAIVKRYSDLHGGQVACESVEGIGTTFTIHLPVSS
nr:PAS domain S-box protein [Acaryochloris thomasi]